MAGRVSELMEERRVVAVRVREGVAGREMYLILSREVVGTVGVQADRGATGVATDDRLGPLQRIGATDNGHGWELNALALGNVEDGEEPEQRIALRRLRIVGVLAFDPLPEDDARAVLAAADASARSLRLAVGEPARVLPAPFERRHRQHERVDAAVGAARAGVAVTACAPRRAPRHRAVLQRQDDAAGDLLVGVTAPAW